MRSSIRMTIEAAGERLRHEVAAENLAAIRPVAGFGRVIGVQFHSGHVEAALLRQLQELSRSATDFEKGAGPALADHRDQRIKDPLKGSRRRFVEGPVLQIAVGGVSIVIPERPGIRRRLLVNGATAGAANDTPGDPSSRLEAVLLVKGWTPRTAGSSDGSDGAIQSQTVNRRTPATAASAGAPSGRAGSTAARPCVQETLHGCP